ncbi:MAG: efflux RND transporter permease subunit, partial [Clostridium sp.]|nr:efflux RND transporter permease subunit [Clostridium sp.]
MFSKFSVKKPFTVLVGVLLVIVLGVVSFTRMTTDLLPNISLPYVIVMTTYPGASPETVETVVTGPVESSMATVSNIESISSVSAENYSIVILEFAQSTDMNGVSLEIRENLDQIKSYWDDGIGSPIIMKLNPDMLPVMIAAAGVEGMDHAQVSTYVQDVIVPELESVEGVASVSTTGLLEESINVILRQELIEEMNKLIYAAIDKKMEEAAQEIEDGQKELDEQREALEDGLSQIASGRQELTSSETDIETGKEELSEKQEETADTLAAAKRDLLTAKSDLEATKMDLTTDLATARTLNTTIAQISFLGSVSTEYNQAYSVIRAKALQDISPGDVQITQEQYEAAIAKIEALKQTFVNHSMVPAILAGIQTMAADNPQMQLLLPMLSVDALKTLSWGVTTPETATHPMIVSTILSAVQTAATTPGGPLATQLENTRDALNAITKSAGFAAYESIVNESLKTINTNLEQVNAAIVETEKGQLTAAIDFANANAAITLGQFQLDAAKTQIDATKEQLDAGKEQLDAAQEQIDEGRKQLEEARKSAYESAELGGILTVDLVKNLLVAQNFAMPAGYVTEAGVDYLVRVGDKPGSVEDLINLPLMDLHMDGVPVITLGDVAEVFHTDNSADIYTNVNGSAGVILTLQKQTGYSTGEVSDLLSARFVRLTEKNPDLSMITLMDQGIYIDLVMDSIITNILFGGALAILILIAFLKDLRPTLV